MANSFLLQFFYNLHPRRILISLIISSTFLPAQPQQYRFDRITVEDGLSNNIVTTILEDSFGFIWFGTHEGLNRYDGKTIKKYIPNGKDTTSLYSGNVRSMVEDSYGNIWIATNALQCYDRFSDNFKTFSPDSNGVHGPRTTPHLLAYDPSGVVWLASWRGLEKYDIKNKSFKQVILDSTFSSPPTSLRIDNRGNVWVGYYHSHVLLSVLKENHEQKYIIQKFTPGNWFPRKGLSWFQLNDFFFDAQDSLWVLSSGGVYIYQPHSEIRHHLFDTTFIYRFFATCATSDHLGRIWVGTLNDGIKIISKQQGVIESIKHTSSNLLSPISQTINTIFADKNDNIWLGTNKGVSKVSRWQKQFYLVDNNTETTNTFPDGEIVAIESDSTNNIWVGIIGKGLVRFDPKFKTFQNYIDRNVLPNPWFRMLITNDSGEVIIPNVPGFRIDKKTKFFQEENFYPKADPINLTPSAYLKEKNGTKWFGFPAAIVRCDQKGYFRIWSKPGDSVGLRDIIVHRIFQDRFGTVWLSTPTLHQYNNTSGKFIPKKGVFVYNTNRRVYSMFEDSNGDFWIGTDICIGKYDRNKDTLLLILNKDSGMIGKKIFGILEDDHKRLWIQSDAGISAIDLNSLRIKNYSISDGIPPPSITTTFSYAGESHLKLRNGIMMFGLGSSGLIIFHPDSIKDNPNIPPVYITGFSIVHNPVPIKHGSILNKNIIHADTIRIRYDQDDFSFEFAALDFTAPEKNQYKYRLEGREEHWINAGNRNTAYYTNIDPGEYRFHVLGSNNDGVWNEKGVSVLIIISPPWWKTSWAYAGYFLVTFTLLFSIRRYEMNRQQLKHGLEIQRVEAEQLKEVNKIKTRFFANISHEFRTPLTLIEGPLKQLLNGEYKENPSELYTMMLRNTRRLLRLVNQLLDLAKVESKEMKLQIRHGDISSHIRSIAASFESAAVRKGIAFSVMSEPESIPAWYDGDALEKIVNNLLSNAFKFTTEGGTITLSLLPVGNGTTARVEVTDSGIGISSVQLEKIFDRFYQVDTTHTREYEGSGIGLSLVKELVELHKGSIDVQSEIQKGTTFIVSLPITKEHFSATEIIDNAVSNTQHEDIAALDEMTTSTVETEPEHNGKLPSLLIIEDNSDMRRYIRLNTEKKFSITESINGEEGLAKALEIIPDIIISDVMMPKMGGFEVCRRLKSDHRTNHIPIILLTAKSGQDDKVGGLETGADEYLIKPFDVKELLIRLHNLQEHRKKMREQIQRTLTSFPDSNNIQSSDDRFLKKIFSILEQNFSDSQFDISTFAEESAMSRMQLHRKIKSLTGYAPGELLRNFRLQRASELLKNRVGNVSEIAFDVGYNNLSHFAAQFREKYGVNPSEYQ